MNAKSMFQKILPHLLIILGFVLISTIYFFPSLQGKTLRQGDLVNVKGTHHSITEYNKQHPNQPALWTDASFSGMPTLIMGMGENNNIFMQIKSYLSFGLPKKTIAILFMFLLSFYIFCLSLNLNRWLSIIGAIGFAFASYKIIIIGAGHINKAHVISFMPIALAGVINIFNQRYKIGFVLSLLGIGLCIVSSHPQISYYLAIAILLFYIIEAYYLIKQKKFQHLIKSSFILLFAAILGLAPATKKLWATYAYSEHSIRGERILEKKEDKHDAGLDKDYALEWSYGKAETFTFLIPNFMGGSSHGVLDESSKTYKNLKSRGVKQPERAAESLSTYWGKMRFTEGPVYFGAIICFLFVLGLFNVRSNIKWWVLAVSVLAIFLSWGKNFEALTDFFFYNIPFYNKFRTVSMILVLVGVTWPMLGIIGFKNFIEEKNKETALKHLKYSFFILAGLLLFFVLFAGGLFDFSAPVDQRYISSGYPEWLINSLREDREILLKNDAFRSLAYISLFAGAMYLFLKKKIQTKYLLLIGGALVFFDLWSVDKRYVNNEDFSEKTIKQTNYQMTPADKYILKDDSHYRVLNVRGPFVEARTSYFHNSIGGYHGAKLRRYQDLIETHLQREINMITNTLSQKNTTQQTVMNTLSEIHCLNMLNTKYIIYNPKSRPLRNPFALGPCWFINDYKYAESANEEIAALRNLDINNKAVFHENFKKYISDIKLKEDTSAKITISDTDLNHKKYYANTSSKQIAVFSEIYYPDGWKAYIDDKEVPILRANYVLRALIIPPGEHQIDFIFKPKSYFIGKNITVISSWIAGIILLLTIIYWFKKLKTDKNKEAKE